MRMTTAARTGTSASAPRNLAVGGAAVLTSSPPHPPQIIIAHAARSGDHLEIHRLLRNVFHGPTQAEFNAQLDAPGYDPSHRVIVSAGREIVAHVRLSRSQIQYGSAVLPACFFMDLATSLPHRGCGYASAVTAEAEARATAAGAVIGLVRTTVADFFTRRGWGVCGRHSFSIVNPFRLLAVLALREESRLGPPSVLRPKVPRVWQVRPFRRLDLPAVMRLEVEQRARRFGAFVRDAVQWEWLLARQAFDRMYVVADAHSPGDVRGYAVACEGRIGELLADRSAAGAAEALAAHLCHDAVELSIPAIRYDGPPDDPIHALAQEANGRHYHEPISGGEVYCVKVLAPQRLGELTSPTGKDRAGETSADLFRSVPWYVPSWEQWTAR